MPKSKKQTEFENRDALASHYKKLTDEQLIAFINSNYQGSEKKYRKAAVINEIKRRGLKID